MTAIETRDLTKEYESVTAISGLDLTVERGEVFGFLGPNGAGKSTTIAVLLDYVRPTSGRARVLGLDAQREAVAVKRRVGVLPEGCALYDRLSGREHLTFAVRARDATDDADAMLDRVGLDDAGDRPVGEYSTGMFQRLSLALALVGEPDLLILDEPTSGMDPNGVRRLREIIAAERERGATVFFSSHVLEQVEAVCDRVGILVDGRLEVSGEPDVLRDDLGPTVRLTVEVDRLPSGLTDALESLSHVRSVSTSGGADDGSPAGPDVVEVALDDDGAKAAVLRRIEEHVTVEDFSSEQRSLDAVFRRYAEEAS